MPAFLALLLFFGFLAVVVGNLLVQAAARRQAAGPLAFVDAPPVGVAPEGTTLAGLDEPTAVRRRRRTPWWRRVHFRRPGTATWLFLALSVLYAAVGAVLVLHYGSIVGDAQSRVADAWYVFFSRDPHLAAIGFVWNPLPSVLVMPLFLFKDIWPALTERAFAGNIMSAVFMAGAVVQLRATLREFGVARAATCVLVAAFALNPMVVYYAANGMSEAFYLFFLILTVRYLAQWLRARTTLPLVLAGVAAGLCYLVRYEAAAAAAVAGAVVLVASFVRAQGSRRARMQFALCDGVVFGLPPAAAFIGWAVVSYVITGHAFEQFSSQYGNASQIAISGGVTAKGLGMPLPAFGMLQMLSYAPLLPILALGVVVLAINRRDWAPAALLVLAAALGFSYFVFVTGGSFPWLRYYLPGVPLAMLCLGLLTEPLSSFLRRLRAGPGIGLTAVWAFGATATTIALIPIAFSGAATTALTMQDKRLGSIERQGLEWVVTGKANTSYGKSQKALVSSVDAIAADIDQRGLPSSSVVVDTFTSCVSMILLRSSRPHQFIITSDRDYQRILADPPAFKAHYLLVPPSGGYGQLDAINREYPQLYDNGKRLGRLVKQYREPGCPPFRLYRFTRSLH